MSLSDGPTVAAPAKAEYKKLEQEKIEAIKKQSFSEFVAAVNATDAEHPFAKMSRHEYADRILEEADSWPKIQQDAVSAQKRKEFDDLEEKLRADLEALNLLEKQPVLGAAPPPAPQSGGWFAGWSKKSEAPAAPTTNAKEVQALHQRLEDAKKHIAPTIRSKSSVAALRDVLIAENPDAFSFKSLDSKSVEDEAGVQVSLFRALPHHQKTAFQRPILHGQQLRNERATKQAHDEQMARLDKVLTPQPEASVQKEMYDAKRRAAKK